MKKNNIFILSILILIYLLLKHIIPYGWYVIYPVNLLVTFLHELGHSLWSLITWWSVKSIEINADWSWLAITTWWFKSIILMWGYIWSAILWNILLYIWSKKENWSENTIYFLASVMIFTSLYWFTWVVSSILLLIVAGSFIILAKKSKFDSIILQFLWIASLLYIIEDFNVWPSSDLAKFSDIFIILPEFVWMYVWLIIVIVITGFNIRYIMKK